MIVLHRDPKNPLVTPDALSPWHSEAAFNPSVVRSSDGTLRLYFRAQGAPSPVIAPFSTGSTIGMAVSNDGGATFEHHQQVIAPRESWEAFGCEDPRAVVIDGKTYVTYTALGGFPYGPGNIKAAIAISDDGESFSERHLVTPFNAKAFALFPEKVGGKFAGIITAHTDYTPDHPRPTIALVLADRIEQFWDPAFWDAWHAELPMHAIPCLKGDDKVHVEVGASPVRTDTGWLIVYSRIQDYYDEAHRSFGIAAALVDLDDPRRLIALSHSFLTPEAWYERRGMIPNIVFPSSAMIEGERLDIYYGGADTVCARASVRLADLMDTLTGPPVFARAAHNPILEPIPTNPFESRLVFNPAAIDLGGSVHLLYRAMGEDNTSTMGYARLTDGVTVDERLATPALSPRAPFELKRGSPTGNSGCEDPRASIIDGRVYVTYTAYDGVRAPQGAVVSISEEDFLAKRFDRWSDPVLATPEGVDDKDLAILPGRPDGKYVLYHRIGGHIVADPLTDLSFTSRAAGTVDIMGPREGMWDGLKIGIASPPHQVDGGWLMLYHGVSRAKGYRIGAVLLDPSGCTLLARAADPIFEPEQVYELVGEVPNVVFPCGSVIRGDDLYIYYGGADRVIGVAVGSVSRILSALR